MTDEPKCDFGILICVDRLVSYYEQLGWKLALNTMIYERFGQPGVVNSNVMVYECAGRALPHGEIDVMGLPA